MTDSEVLTVQQVLGDGRFAEVGEVRLTESDPSGSYVAAGVRWDIRSGPGTAC